MTPSRPIRPAKSRLPYLDPVAAERDRLKRDNAEWRAAHGSALDRIDALEDALRAAAAKAYAVRGTDKGELERACSEIQAVAEKALRPHTAKEDK